MTGVVMACALALDLTASRARRHPPGIPGDQNRVNVSVET